MPAALYRRQGKIVSVDECAQVSFYQHKVLSFWAHHPGEKVQLAAQASLMLWNPVVSPPPTRSDAVGWLTDLRDTVEPVFIGIVFLLALVRRLSRAPPLRCALAAAARLPVGAGGDLRRRDPLPRSMGLHPVPPRRRSRGRPHRPNPASPGEPGSSMTAISALPRLPATVSPRPTLRRVSDHATDLPDPGTDQPDLTVSAGSTSLSITPSDVALVSSGSGRWRG